MKAAVRLLGNASRCAALKPGGVYFILDPEAGADETDAQIAVLHRIQKTRVIREVTAAGFRFVAEGRFLFRPDDDDARPIFDLHGHTDPYALRFVRPQASSDATKPP